MQNLRGFAQHDATAIPGYGITHGSGKCISHPSSQQAQTPADTQLSGQPSKKAKSRSRNRESRK